LYNPVFHNWEPTELIGNARLKSTVPDLNICNAVMGVRRVGKNGHFLPPLEIGTKNRKFLENLKLAGKF